MTYTVECCQRSAQATLSIKMVSESCCAEEVAGPAWERLAAYLVEQGLDPVEDTQAFAAYHNLDMQCPDMQKIDLEVGFLVSGPLPASGDMQPGQIPGGKYATIQYSGPTRKIGKAYAVLIDWLSENGYDTCGSVYEIILRRPEQDEQQTCVIFLLK